MKYSLLAIALLAACGDDGGVNNLPDAPIPGMASVTIRIGGVPVAGRTVYFQGPDGAELATVETDANGMASAVVQAGSSVTALDILEVRFNRPGRNVVTIMGVKPGDELMLTGDHDLPTPDVTFTYPAYTGTNPLYGILSNCNNEETGTTTSSTRSVPRCSPRFDAMALVVDGFGHAGAYISKPDQPFGNVDFTGETWTEVPTVPGSTYTNIATSAPVSSRHLVTSPRGFMFDCNADDGGMGPTYTAQISCPPMPGATTLDVLSFSEENITYEITHLVTTAAPTRDLADTSIKALVGADTVDVATRTLRWKQTMTGADPDFVVVHLASPELDWHILAPYSESALTLPRLLGDGAIHDLDEETEVYPDITTGIATGGYDAIRRFGPNYLDNITTEIARIITARHNGDG